MLRNELVGMFICPICESRLRLKVLSRVRKDGVLRCANGHAYPVIQGLAKILVGGLESDYSEFVAQYRDVLESENIVFHSESDARVDSRQDQATFGEKWTSKDSMGISDSSPYKAFMRGWMLRKYGWKDESDFTTELEGRRFILDAGAGLGREVINLAKSAPKSVVIGLEFSDCAVNAVKNVSSLPNAYIIQGDILNMPFAKGSFDFILSEGVLHHTPNTREAFQKCCKVLKKGGEIAFYIYRKKGPLREFADDYFRQIMQNASAEEKWKIAESITAMGKALSDARAVVRITQDIAALGIKKGDFELQRFVYYNFLKCFWNDHLPFDENSIINFDWYAPLHAHRHTENELRAWCKENSVEIVWFHGEDSGYSVRGLKT